MKSTLAVVFFLAYTLAAGGQAQRLTFEVASIKPVGELSQSGASVTDPSLFSMKPVTLTALLMRAYGLKPFQISGPDWLDKQHYDLEAKLPAGATPDQVPEMLQQLLTERFQMTLRWDTKQETGYALIIDKGGPKLTPSALQHMDGDKPGKARGVMMYNTVQMQGAPIADLANFVSVILGQPVADSTGLKGRFDIILPVAYKDLLASRQGPSTSPSAGVDDMRGNIFDAVRDLGLRLQPQKVEVKQLTVVKAERIPTEN